MEVKVFEGFAGYGGASFAMKRLNEKEIGFTFDVVGYSEVDKAAVELYNLNHRNISGENVKNWGDITKINPYELPAFDMFTGGFPCQPFSTAGLRKGELDPKGSLFAEIIKICQARRPRFIFLENVVGLCRGKLRPTYEAILDLLDLIGYDVQTCILNSKDYGIPQNRQRLWFFGVHRDFGGLPEGFDIEPQKQPLKGYLKNFLDTNPDEELYRSEKQMEHIHKIHDKSDDYFHVQEPLCYDYYNRKIRTDGICMTVTPPSHNVVRIVEPLKDGKERFRKLSLDEHFRLMGFEINDKEREIIYPENLTYTQLGERAGNGWEINVVTVLLEHIFNQIE